MKKIQYVSYKDRQIFIGYENNLNKLNKTTSKRTKIRYRYKFVRIQKLANNLNNIIELMKQKIIDSNEIEKQCAFSILLLIETGMRIGNENSAKGYICNLKKHELFEKEVQTYGLSTLLNKHLKFENDKLIFNFIGKKLVEQNIELENNYLIEASKIFYNKDKPEEKFLNINIPLIKKFILENIGKDFNIKDFRTLKACLEAGLTCNLLLEIKRPDKKREQRNEVKSIYQKVSEYLGNTPGICKSAYINPDIIEIFNKNRNYI